VNYHNTGALSLRRSMDGRATDRVDDIDVDPIDRRGTLVSNINGNAEQARFFIENYSPKPSTVTAIQYEFDHTSRRS
jgi:hypothetical protein